MVSWSRGLVVPPVTAKPKEAHWKPPSGLVGDAWTFGDQQGILVSPVVLVGVCPLHH